MTRYRKDNQVQARCVIRRKGHDSNHKQNLDKEVYGKSSFQKLRKHHMSRPEKFIKVITKRQKLRKIHISRFKKTMKIHFCRPERFRTIYNSMPEKEINTQKFDVSLLLVFILFPGPKNS